MAGTSELEITNNSQWIELALNKSIALASYNYSYHLGNEFREDMFSLLKDNLAKIGLFVEGVGISWAYSFYDTPEDINKLELYWIGHAPDFNDLSNYVHNLLHNKSSQNSALVNDKKLEKWMAEGLNTTDQSKRAKIYYKIQKRVVGELYPWVMGYVSNVLSAYSSNLKGYPFNAMGITYYYTCYIK